MDGLLMALKFLKDPIDDLWVAFGHVLRKFGVCLFCAHM